MPSYFEMFKEVLKSKSDSTNYNEMLKEWKFTGVIHEHYNDLNAKCICNHIIIYGYQIKNQKNGNILEVGSECVKKVSEDDFLICKSLENSYKKMLKGKIETLNEIQVSNLINFQYLYPKESMYFTKDKSNKNNETLSRISNRILNKINKSIPLSYEKLSYYYKEGDSLSNEDYNDILSVIQSERDRNFILNVFASIRITTKQAKWINDIIGRIKSL